MMNGDGKSDSAIVAMKPANEAQRCAKELVEPRAGAKGNAGEHSTRRTQSRESVTHGLERIRQIAKERNKEKFTALLHHISPELLQAQFFALKKQAAAGIDGLSCPWR